MSTEHAGGSGGFPTTPVPNELRRSAFPIFFIVTGTLCSLPVFVLSGRLVRDLGQPQAVFAFIAAGLISGGLAALGAYSGARTGLNVAILSEYAFGRHGSKLVRLILAGCLLGWYVVIANLLGATVSGTLASAWGISVSAQLVTCAALILVAWIAHRGVRGLQWVAAVLVPLTVVLLSYAAFHGYGVTSTGSSHVVGDTGALSRAMSEIIGIYIVGIVIQPDFGRFARSAPAAALASFTALAVAYPVILMVSGVAAVWLNASDLVGALIVLGAAIPAVIILAGGATIDSSFSLYSGSVGLANLLGQSSTRNAILAATAIGLIVSFLPAQDLFISYLTVLGLALPPLAIVIAINSVRLKISNGEIDREQKAFRFEAIIAWVIGVTVGYLTSRGMVTATGISAVDSLVATAMAYAILRSIDARMSRPIADQQT